MGCASSSGVATPQASGDFFGCYALGVKLGRGAFGQVRTATPLDAKRNSGAAEDFAVKILDLRDKEEPDRMSSALQKTASSEASLWMKTKGHANVVRLQDVFYDEVLCYFVMERCTSSLYAHLENISVLDERSVGNIIKQMFLGIQHVHGTGIVHRDVKPDNFLTGGADGATVKLCDFGLSAELPSVGRTKGHVKGCYGTAPYMCPEMIKGDYYDGRADVWSMGVLAYTLIFGTFPYSPKISHSKAMKQAIVEGKRPTFEPVAPCIGQKRTDSAVEFVKTLLERSAVARPSASKALGMDYMVAAKVNSHMNDTELPSLRPMIYTAKRAGAFELPDLTKVADIDPLLSKKHEEKHGAPLPGQSSEHYILGKTSRYLSKQRTKSGRWQTTQSDTTLNSRIWDNTLSFATTASPSSSLRGTASPSDSSSPRRSAATYSSPAPVRQVTGLSQAS